MFLSLRLYMWVNLKIICELGQLLSGIGYCLPGGNHFCKNRFMFYGRLGQVRHTFEFLLKKLVETNEVKLNFPQIPLIFTPENDHFRYK